MHSQESWPAMMQPGSDGSWPTRPNTGLGLSRLGRRPGDERPGGRGRRASVSAKVGNRVRQRTSGRWLIVCGGPDKWQFDSRPGRGAAGVVAVQVDPGRGPSAITKVDFDALLSLSTTTSCIERAV